MRRKRKSKLHGVTNTVQFRQNHFAITNALINLFEEKKHSPTQAEIAKRCNLSRKCVNEHLRDLKLEDVTPSIKSETLEILSGLSEKAKTGDPSAVKLWMQLVHGWKETQLHDIPPDSNFEIIIGKKENNADKKNINS